MGRLSKHLDKKTDNYSIASRKKLRAAINHKIKRIFVGCLDAVEKELGISSTSSGDDAEAFRKLRSKILSIGNDQIRNMETELERYNVEFIPYHIEFVMKEDGEVSNG